MADMTVTVPDQYLGDVYGAARDLLGDAAQGRSDAQAFQEAARRLLATEVRRHRRRIKVGVQTQAVADAVAASAASEAAAATAVQARKDAEDADDAAVNTAFGVS